MSRGEETAGLEAAKYIAGLGGHCIPAYVDRFDEKRPMVKDWVNAGTRSSEDLEGMWRVYPYAWPGVVTQPGGLIVFDLDGKNAVDWFRELAASAGGVGEGCFVYRTPGRDTGCHIWYRWPGYLAPLHKAQYKGGVEWTGAAELRGVGCWTLWAGAKRKSGDYELLQTPSELTELPRELWLAFARVSEQAITGGGDSGELRSLNPEEAWGAAPWTDGRKQAVAGLCWWMAVRGYTEQEIVEVACLFAQECCYPELDCALARRKGEYAYQRAQKIRDKQEAEQARMNRATEQWRNRR